MRWLPFHRDAQTALLRAINWFVLLRFSRRPAQGLVEYALILVLIMVVCVGVLTLEGQTIRDLWYEKIVNAFPT